MTDAIYIALLALAYVPLSALLYRVPRGGPNPDVWRKLVGFAGPGSFGGALVWAAFTALPALWISWLAYPLAVGLLMLAEAPGWADYWPSHPGGGDVWKLTLRGLPLLNPFMGFIYFRLYVVRDRLRVRGWFLDGWTAYAELACGAVTAISFWGIATAIAW